MRSTLLGLMLVCTVACDDGAGDGTDAATTPDAVPGDDAGPEGDGGGADAARPRPDITVEPLQLQLTAPLATDGEPVAFTVRNDGSAPLNVAGVDVGSGLSSDAFFTLLGAPQWPVELAPGASLPLTLGYHPLLPGEHRTTLFIRSDDPDEPRLSLPATGRVLAACVRVAPDRLDLGTVGRGAQSGRFRVELSSCGDVEVTVLDIRIEGDSRFAWEPDRGESPLGRTLRRGAVAPLAVTYRNEALLPGERATGQLVIETDAPTAPRLEVPLSVTGGGGPGCDVLVRPGQLEFGVVRIGTTRSLTAEAVNVGDQACGFRELRLEQANGLPVEVFSITRGIDAAQLEPGAVHSVEVTFHPENVRPQGDRATLSVDFYDPRQDENRRAVAQLFGVGDIAQIGAVPPRVDFGRVTAPDGCGSEAQVARAENVGFVDLCVTAWRIEGEHCDRFALLEAPEVPADGCLRLEPGAGADFRFQYQPDDVGAHTCAVVVGADAMNTDELALELAGDGVAEAASRDTFVAGRIAPNRAARFRLSRLAVPGTVTVAVEGVVNDEVELDEERNEVVFPVGQHPAEGERVQADYEARCLERQ